MINKKITQIFLFSLALIVSCGAPASALDRADANKFSVNNILFYDPSEDTCGDEDNGIFKGAQFTFDDEELRKLVRAAKNENGCNIEAIKTELSIMANLYEKNGADFDSLGSYIATGKWFASSTKEAYNNGTADVSDEELNAAKEVLLKGNRTLPPQIVEHDCIASIKGCTNQISNDEGKTWITVTVNDKDKFTKDKTWIKTIDGDSYYIFYRWAGGSNSTCGDPFGYYPDNPPDSSYSTTSSTGTNKNYAGDTVWSEAELQAIEANRAIYEEAAKEHGFPWQVMAVLHSMETGLRRYNPGNGQGVYQLYSYTNGGTNANRFEPAESISEEEFRRQTKIAAGVAVQMAGDLSNPDNVKKLFFMYNGTASQYKQKALNMGFSQEEANNGEGSIYVMNRYDARRDPTSSEMDSHWPGRFVGDGVYDEDSTTEVFGAFVKYEALGKTSVCTDSNIAETAIKLSWPGNRSHNKDDPKPEYVKAMKEVDAYISGCNSSGCAPIGASCDQFVGTVMRYSGADPEFPIFGPGTQESHMKNHPEMYKEIEHHDDISNLRPGDIFVANNDGNHIYMYVGEIDGQPTQASASFNDRTGEHFTGVYFQDTYTASGTGYRYYHVYRRINY